MIPSESEKLIKETNTITLSCMNWILCLSFVRVSTVDNTRVVIYKLCNFKTDLDSEVCIWK